MHVQMELISEDHIVRGPVGDIDIPDSDIWTFISEHFKQYGERTALVDSSSNESITYHELYNRSEAMAANLIHSGYDVSKPVSLYMKNCIEYAVILAAVWRVGGKVVCLSSLLTTEEVQRSMGMLASEFLFCDSSTVQCAVRCLDNMTLTIYVKGAHPKCLPISSLLQRDSLRLIKTGVAVKPKQDVALIMFSSGTTGLPKAVEITHRGVIAQTHMFGNVQMDCLPQPTGIIYQPMSHVYGLCLSISHLKYGVKAVLMTQFHLEKYVALVEEHKVDQLYIVPPIAVALTRSNVSSKYNWSHVRSISSGGAPLYAEMEQQLCEMLPPGVQIKQSWGMTELVCMATTVPSSEICQKLGFTVPQGSIGWPVPNVRMKVVDTSTGDVLGPGKQGEVCAKADYFMKGYYNNTKATEETIDREGWLHTGDIGYYDGNGFFFIVDKIKEIMKYKYYQVAPAELEAVLLTHPAVADVGVTGIPDKSSGELPHAWVVTKPGHTCRETDLITFVNGKVAAFKRLRGGVRFVEEIPKSASGKILRREIRRLSLASMNKL